jgi:hypothetical protein
VTSGIVDSGGHPPEVADVVLTSPDTEEAWLFRFFRFPVPDDDDLSRSLCFFPEAELLLADLLSFSGFDDPPDKTGPDSGLGLLPEASDPLLFGPA